MRLPLLAFLCTAVAISAWGQEYQPDYSLQPRPDVPGLESIEMPPPLPMSLFDGPASPDQHDTWLAGLKGWRDARKKEIGYKGDLYAQGSLDWARHVFTQAQILVWDRSLYDPATGKYTVDRALNGLTGRFGPIDSVLIWPAYPNLGLDARNQFDLMRDAPGGVAGLRTLVADFHKRGIRVFLPVLVWGPRHTRCRRVARQRGSRPADRCRCGRHQFRYACCGSG